MHIEIIAIGDEILSGLTLNSNATWISSELFKKGILVQKQTTLGDNETTLHCALEKALNENDIVIATGGLGPTSDDITRAIAASLFNSPFAYSEKIAEDLKNRYGSSLTSLKDQATLPTKATYLKNRFGTAYGLLFEEHGKILILLPGPPSEMRPMFLESVLPFIEEKAKNSLLFFHKSLDLAKVIENEVDPLIRQLKTKHSRVIFGIYPDLGTLSLRLSVQATDEKEAMSLLEEPYNTLFEAFKKNVYISASHKIEESVHTLLIEKKWSLSLAESCTGGSISSKLTKIPGASTYFSGSVVAYSNKVKTEILKVSPSLLKEKGAVSQEVVIAMAEGLFPLFGSTISLSVSGVAGPTGGTKEKPVGTVYFAFSHQIPGISQKKTTPYKITVFGTRDTIIERASNLILGELYLYLKNLAV